MAASKIGFVIEGDASGAVRSVKLTDQQLDALNKTQKRGTTIARNYAKEAGRIAANLGKYAAIAGGVALTATAAIVNKQREQIDTLAKTADKLGVTTEALGQLRYAAELTGVQNKQLDVGLQRMVRRLADVAETGKGPAADALEILNLKIEDLKNLSPDEQVSMIADAMGGLENQSQRVAVAFKLFDSEGVGLVNTLALGSDGLAKMAAEADKLGITLSRVEAARVEQANDQLTRVGGLIDGIGKQITVQAAPIIAGLAEEFLNVARESGGMAEVVGKAMDFLVGAAGQFGNALRILHRMFKGLEVVALSLARAVIQQFGKIAKAANELNNQVNEFLGKDAIPYEETFFGTLERSIQGSLFDAIGELHELANEEWPSDSIKEWHHTVKSRAEETARAVAENSERVATSTSEMTEDVANETGKAVAKIATESENIWADKLRTAITDFESFKRDMIRQAESLISQIAVRFARQQLGLNVGVNVAGGAGGGVGAFAANQVFGGGGGFSGSMIGSMLGAGGASASISHLFQPAGGFTTANTAQLTPGGLTTDLGTSANTGGFWDTNLGTGLANIGAGIAGGFVGTNVGSAITGKNANSNVGAGIGGTAGAMIGGPIGSFIGSTIGGFLDSLFGSGGYDRWFKIQPGAGDIGRQGFDGANIGNISQSRFGSVTFNTEGQLFKGASEEQAQGVIQTLEALADLEDIIAGELSPEKISAVRNAVRQQQAFDRTESTDFTPFFLERFNTIFDEIGGELDDTFDSLTRAMSPKEFVGSVDQVIAAVFQLEEVADQLDADIFDEVARAVERENDARSEQQRVYDATLEQLTDVIAEFDRSRDSIASLASALNAQQSAAAQLAAAYHQAADAARNIFANTIDAIREEVSTPEELYNQRRASITQQISELSSLTDPGAINARVAQINNLARSAFGLLDEGQKAALSGEFVSFLEQANATAQQRIQTGLNQLEQETEAAADVVEVEITNADDILDAALRFGVGTERFANFVSSLGIDVDHFGSQVALITNSTQDLSQTASALVLAHQDVFAAAQEFGVNSAQFEAAVAALGLDVDQLDAAILNQLGVANTFQGAAWQSSVAANRFANIISQLNSGQITLTQAAQMFQNGVNNFINNSGIDIRFNLPPDWRGPPPGNQQRFALGTNRNFEINF